MGAGRFAPLAGGAQARVRQCVQAERNVSTTLIQTRLVFRRVHVAATASFGSSELVGTVVIPLSA
jgi:hypothetical protein